MNDSERAICNGFPRKCKNNKTTNKLMDHSFSTATGIANQTIIETTTTTTTCTTTMTSSSPKAPTKADSMSTFRPTNIDVLCGRGGAAIQHPGNKAYRAMVASQRTIYHSSAKNKKKIISMSIVEKIREKGGRFLQKREPSSSTKGKTIWVEIGNDKAVAKTCQALRERVYTKKPHAYRRRLGDFPKTNVAVQHSEPTNQRSKRSSDLPSTDAKEEDHHNRSPKKKVTEYPIDGAVREPIAILNGLSYSSGSGNWEWKLFDFCDEEQTRQDDQLVPHLPSLPISPAVVPSFPVAKKLLPHHVLEHQQYQPEPDQMISSSKLYGCANTQSLAPPASMPVAKEVPVKRRY